MKDMKEKQEIQSAAISSSGQIPNPVTLPNKALAIVEPNEIDPKEKIEPKSLTELGFEHCEARQYAKALEYFTNAIKQNSNDKHLWTACGIEYVNSFV